MADHAKPGLKLSNQTYDIGRNLTQYWLPATGALYFTLSEIWNLPYAIQIVGTIAAIEIFLGVVLGLSKKSYEDSDAPYDGSLVVGKDADGNSQIFRLEAEAPLEELGKKSVLLRIDDAATQK